MQALQAKQQLEIKPIEVQCQEAQAATENARRQICQALEESASLEKNIAQTIAEDEVLQRQRKSLEVLNQRFSNEQRQVENVAANKEEQRRAARQQRDRTVEELQQQIR